MNTNQKQPVLIAGTAIAVGLLLLAIFNTYIGYTAVQNDTQSFQEIATTTIKTALLANGCFWCVEADLEKVDGVERVLSGYAGGTGENPTYKTYSSQGHREVVEVTYDSTKVSYENLVEHILKHGDPTDPDGSFGDRGKQYAPAIYYETEEEKLAAQKVVQAIDAMKVYPKPIAIVIIPRVAFWPAEEYHQDYAKKNSIVYNSYRKLSGRSPFIEKYWGGKEGEFTASAKPAASNSIEP